MNSSWSDLIVAKRQANPMGLAAGKTSQFEAEPYPGALEKVADRSTNAINNAMWQAI